MWKSLSEVDFQKLFSGAINLPGVFAIILRTFGAGPGVWGEGPVLDPLLTGKRANCYKSTTTKPFGVAKADSWTTNFWILSSKVRLAEFCQKVHLALFVESGCARKG